VEVEGLAAAPRVGAPAPGFTATAIDGSEVSLDALRGRPVWLVFVATWCSGCRAEMPDVQAAHQAAGADGVEVVAIYVGEDQSEVGPYAERLGLTFPQLPDPQTRLAASYGVLGVPAHFFIDADGVVRQTRVGILNPDQMTEAISQAAS
ncbi:MAG: TlpA disulfide reductase family protein, partial [Brooklawnia sp.]|uniref:TlpA family protein disulfide reductase n=1 Tax=Brooklawnia sp. TaxID=2699740 RepID=UPI003C764D40